MSLPVAVAEWVVALGALGLLTAILWIVALVDLAGKWSELERRQRSAWILMIVLLPVVGSVLYLAQRPR